MLPIYSFEKNDQLADRAFARLQLPRKLRQSGTNLSHGYGASTSKIPKLLDHDKT